MVFHREISVTKFVVEGHILNTQTLVPAIDEEGALLDHFDLGLVVQVMLNLGTNNIAVPLLRKPDHSAESYGERLHFLLIFILLIIKNHND